MIEQAVTACVNENMDLACAFVQKTTVDKAVIEIDRHLFSARNNFNVLKMNVELFCTALNY